MLFFLLILKPKVAYSYIEGWVFNIKIIKKTIHKRKWVQENRVISDFEIFKKMYYGSGKYLLLKDFVQINLNKK